MGAADYPIINDQTLPAIIEQEIANAIGSIDGQLSVTRAQEFDFYYARPFGNEVDGESQVISTDVADTVEGMLPILLNIFTASDDVVRFDPNGPEDEAQAAQQTEVANYVFYRQNNGFLVLYEWFKDALIQKNGVVKYWWDDKKTNTVEEYRGLSQGEYQNLLEDETALEVQKIEETVYDDPAAIEARRLMVEEINTKVPPERRAQFMQALEMQPIPQLYDCKLKIVKDASQIRIEAIAPEEFGISAARNSVTIQDTPFCYHRTRKTISSLREMGCPEEILLELPPANDPDISPEALARDKYLDDTWRTDGGPMQIDREVWVTDCYIRCDYDGDGIAELRHIIMPGRTIWINEECDHICFAAITPIIMPHRWIGRSVAELVMDIQFNKSVLWRQQFNNLYLTNNPQKAVLSSAGGIVQANLDDLMSSRPGGILREYQPNAIRNIETPFVAAASFPMLEYMDSVKENRTGVTRYNQGTDSDSLNKTARGIQMIQSAGAQRTNLIARVFAETGVKDLMRGIVYMLSKYSQRRITMRLRNEWVDVDPREWKTQFNMTVNVGLGTGNRDVQLAHLAQLHADQIELMKAGRGYMVSDENMYNLYKKRAEAMGFKHPELFVTAPENVDPSAKQKQPDPAALKVMADAKEGQAKLQQSSQKMMVDAKVQESIAQINAQAQIAIAQMNNASKESIEKMKLGAQAQLTVFEKQADAGSQGAEAEQAMQKKAVELQLRELEVRRQEEMLALQKQVEQMAVRHAQEITQATVQGSQERDSTAAQTVQAVGQELQKLVQTTTGSLVMQQQSVELLQKLLAAFLAPRHSELSDIRMENGKVTGATVKSTLRTIQ